MKSLGPGLLLFVAACAARSPAPGTPAWGDDSRSGLTAQGTAIAPEKSEAPPQVSAPAPERAETAAAAAAPPPPPSAGEESPLPPGAPVVRLLEAGREPRQRLRYRLGAARSEQSTMDITTTISTALAGGAPGPEITPPGVRMVETVSSAPAGPDRLSQASRLIQVDTLEGTSPLAPAMAERMRAELRKMVGTTTDATLNTRGVVLESKTVLPPTATPSPANPADRGQNQFGRALVLPAEPVGAGARWEVEMDVQQQGMTVHQRAVYRLRELVGSRLELDVTAEQSAGAQEVKLAGAGGAAVQLESLRGSGSGTLSADLTSLVPRQGRIDLDCELAMRVQAMAMSMRMKMSMASRAGR